MAAMRDHSAYKHWRGMMSRCFSYSSQQYCPTYTGATVHMPWYDFWTFVAWCETQVGFGEALWQLDKDLLRPGNMHYSPENCRFVPNELNSLFAKGRGKVSGLPKGVSVIESTGRYRARATLLGEKLVDCVFATEQEAVEAYKIGKLKLVHKQAEKWKDRIAPDLYLRLANMEVNHL